jgi:hypothetical protein
MPYRGVDVDGELLVREVGAAGKATRQMPEQAISLASSAADSV